MIGIQKSKHIAPLILAFSIVIKKNIIVDKFPNIEDVNYMLKVMKELGFEIKSKCEIVSSNYYMDNWSKFEANIRQNILFLPVCLYQKKTIFPFPHGDIIGKRPIDGYFDILDKFGFSVIIKNNSICINRNKILFPTNIRLSVDSTGITIFVIFFLIILYEIYKKDTQNIILENISIDLEVEQFIDFLNKNSKLKAFEFLSKKKKIVFKPNLYVPKNTFIYTVPIDRIVLFDIILFMAMQKIKGFMTNSEGIQISKNKFEKILGIDVIHILKDINIEFEYIRDKVFVITKNSNVNKTKLFYRAEKYPSLSTDMLPILITYVTILNYCVDAKDDYFEDRIPLLFEQINKVEKSDSISIVWESYNIRQTVCGLMYLIYTDKIEKVIDYNNSIFRGYEQKFISIISEITGVRIKTIIQKEGVMFTK